MSLTLETTPDNCDRGALMYGPLVLAGELGTDGMNGSSPFSDPKLYNDYYTYNYHIPEGLNISLKINPENPAENVHRIGDSLQFTTDNGEVITPLYNIHRQRYVVYWDLITD